MSDSDLAPSPIEQRLRRTLAVRAEDMAAGDGAVGDHDVQFLLAQSAGSTDQRHRDHGRRSRSRFQLAAALVVIVGLGLAAVGAVVANGDGDGDGDVADDGSGGSSAAHVALVTAPRDLVTALQDERNLVTNQLIGTAEAMSLPVDDAGEARSRTDAAVAALDAAVTADPAGSVYQVALDGLDGLGAVRDAIDAYTNPRTIDNIALATEVFDDYADMIGGLLEAQSEAARSIEDAELAVGAELHVRGLRLQELTELLGRTAVLHAIAPGTSATTELGALHAEVGLVQEEVRELAAGTPYEAAVTTVVEQVEASGLLDIVGAGLQGTTDLPALLAALDLPPDQGWPAFLDQVEQLLADAS